MSMLAVVRTPGESDTAVTERLNALFATEAERVANAAVLAEMLVPMVAEQLRSLPAPSAPAPLAASPLPEAPAAPKPAVRPASIADFIDDMIAQESPPLRSGRGSERRAS